MFRGRLKSCWYKWRGNVRTMGISNRTLCWYRSHDELWISRYIMERICENHNILVSWHPKPIKEIGMVLTLHKLYTLSMRLSGNKELFTKIIDKLKVNHEKHIKVYGDNNDERIQVNTKQHPLINLHMVLLIEVSLEFQEASEEWKGYIEDRRPASNMDPYLVTSIMRNRHY